MNSDSWQARLRTFLRSVIPADPAQLLFLAGIVCLIFGSRMSWWPRRLGSPLDSLGVFDSEKARFDSYELAVLGTYAMIFSTFAGYYACFWPGLRPVRRVLSLVIAPIVGGICLNLGPYVYLTRSYSSILDHRTLSGYFQAGQLRFLITSPGFHVVFLGLVLIGIFTLRMIRGTSCLPVGLPAVSNPDFPEAKLWARIRFLIWILVGPLVLMVAILGGILVFPLAFLRNAATIVYEPLFQYLALIFGAALSLVVACWIVGKEGREICRNSIQYSRANYLLLGVGCPVGIAFLISSGHYLFDRAHWAATQFGNMEAPQASRYFSLPSPWLLLLFFAAFVEEVIFRGLLQTIFVRRYGLYRGIFVTGIAWAAYHFNSDASFAHVDELGAASKVSFRLALCLSLGFVLSWLSLRSGSILPASIAHTLHNVLVDQLDPRFPGKPEVWVAMWAILACVLFRYWPVPASNEIRVALPVAEPGIEAQSP